LFSVLLAESVRQFLSPPQWFPMPPTPPFLPDCPNKALELQFPNDTTWSQWQASGQDAHGQVADPLFADPATGNFTLLPSSPAFSMSIQQIDLAFGVGPRSAKTGLARALQLQPINP